MMDIFCNQSWVLETLILSAYCFSTPCPFFTHVTQHSKPCHQKVLCACFEMWSCQKNSSDVSIVLLLLYYLLFLYLLGLHVTVHALYEHQLLSLS